MLGDYNGCTINDHMRVVCNTFKFESLIPEPTFSKNPENHCCRDSILTNRPHSIQNCCVFETGLSDFHRMTYCN